MNVLKDTSLCAIVRDEKMNPAGGVERFLRCHLPYVEEAVVLDTGSTDGTREILDQMAKEFSHLKVFDAKFEGFAQARNLSLGNVRTKWALVLDVDELIEPTSFNYLSEILIESGQDPIGFNFALMEIAFDGTPSTGYLLLHNPRLFDINKKFAYKNKTSTCLEWLYNARGEYVRSMQEVFSIPSSLPILHFLPPLEGLKIKRDNWYIPAMRPDLSSLCPSESQGYVEWKKLNPHRAKYPG